MISVRALTLLSAAVLISCAPEEDQAPASGNASSGDDSAAGIAVPVLPEPQESFWDDLARHCGNAYPGGLTLEPPGDEMLTGTEELIVHFRECGEEELRLPFHIEIEETGEWDRSRTWVFIRNPDGLELRHDHRRPDGTDDDVTWYGAVSTDPGTPQRQEFLSAQRTEESGYERGWRVEIVPGERYTYGTTRRGEWSWRVDFDLTDPIPPPPPPWGFEGSPAAPD